MRCHRFEAHGERAVLQKPRCSAPGALLARSLDGRFSGSAFCASGSGRTEPVAQRDFAADGEWQQEYDHWQRRDLSAQRYVYMWADGVYLQARMEPQAECMLVILGATPEGSEAETKTPWGGVFLPNELVGFQVGVRESAQSWRELLVDIKARGLKVPPEIAVGDGAMG